MKSSIQHKLSRLADRHEEIRALLISPEVTKDAKRFAELSKEYSQLEPVTQAFHQYQVTQEELTALQALLDDPEMKGLVQEESNALKIKLEVIDKDLELLLLPKDPNDNKNIFLEIRAGTGGAEAAIFAGELFRMYSKYAESQSWRVELISASDGEHGGYKEIIARISGQDVYSKVKFESGVHRVQRVPETEAQGRVHTSTCTVAIMPEVDEIEAVDINPKDLRVDTFRASGAGGQHVNRTDSAVRITHIPSGIVVECQDERSQHKNKARAMSVLRAKLLASERKKQKAEETEARRNLIGTGDRSERIRTYNYPQERLTDHRINLTLYKLSDVMEGKLNQVIGPLTQEHQADLLAMIEKG